MDLKTWLQHLFLGWREPTPLLTPIPMGELNFHHSAPGRTQISLSKVKYSLVWKTTLNGLPSEGQV